MYTVSLFGFAIYVILFPLVLFLRRKATRRFREVGELAPREHHRGVRPFALVPQLLPALLAKGISRCIGSIYVYICICIYVYIDTYIYTYIRSWCAAIRFGSAISFSFTYQRYI